jgi:hypothetical protein
MIPTHAFRDLYPSAFKVYVFADAHLDRHEWRAMKLELVMLGCRMEKATAVDALRTLVKRAYVVRRGGGPKPYEYRLLPPPMPNVKGVAA